MTVYGETFSVTQTIERILKLNRGYIHEIIIAISPRSSKESFDVCNSLAEKYPFVKVLVQKNNPGAGWAYREGMAAATGNFITLMSGDLETEPEAVDRMVKKIEETDCDGVMTSRWLPGGALVNYDKKKMVLNWFFQKIFRIVYWTKLTDLTYGFKTLSKEVVDSIKWSGTLHEIFIETTVKPLKKGYKLEEIATVWIGRKEGASKNTFMRNFRYISLAIKVRFSNPKNI